MYLIQSILNKQIIFKNWTMMVHQLTIKYCSVICVIVQYDPRKCFCSNLFKLVKIRLRNSEIASRDNWFNTTSNIILWWWSWEEWVFVCVCGCACVRVCVFIRLIQCSGGDSCTLLDTGQGRLANYAHVPICVVQNIFCKYRISAVSPY